MRLLGGTAPKQKALTERTRDDETTAKGQARARNSIGAPLEREAQAPARYQTQASQTVGNALDLEHYSRLI